MLSCCDAAFSLRRPLLPALSIAGNQPAKLLFFSDVILLSLAKMKKKILVVESDRDIREIISYILKEEGYEPILCNPEADIIQMIQLNEPAAVFLDIMEITERGTELCRVLKAGKQTSHIPVIVLSTHPKIERVKEICADEVIKKPFDIDVLMDVLKEQLAA